MKTIELQSYGIVLTVDPDNPGAGTITSDLERQTCPYCSQADCCFSCDESQASGWTVEAGKLAESSDDLASRLKYNGILDGIESMILAHSCADIDVTTPEYLEGIETAVQAAENNS